MGSVVSFVPSWGSDSWVSAVSSFSSTSCGGVSCVDAIDKDEWDEGATGTSFCTVERSHRRQLTEDVCRQCRNAHSHFPLVFHYEYE